MAMDHARLRNVSSIPKSKVIARKIQFDSGVRPSGIRIVKRRALEVLTAVETELALSDALAVEILARHDASKNAGVRG